MIGIKVICASVGIIMFFTVFPANARPQDVVETETIESRFIFDGPTDRRNPFHYPGSRFTTTTTTTTTERPIITFTVQTPAITSAPTTANPLTTTSSPEFIACTRSCLSTPEYNPLCGSDMVVYNNPGKLACANSCGRDVQMLYYGKCTSTIRG